MRLYRIGPRGRYRLVRQLIGQAPGVEAVARAEDDALLPVEHVGDDAARKVGVEIVMPEQFAFIGRIDDRVLLIVAGDDQIACGGEDAGTYGRGRVVQVGIDVSPSSIAGERID